ncbi:ATP-binding protein [Alloalcanivorax gelatiniphagus]|uniref:histidine kinase n=1 Tax=Alloalcanivorax gelatiniphagus TaxID=1194167 RepID=A0ABY2XIT1_9GAMM|nr:ATP-binding protein [Alloalcanivorax gelatiniphagus]TMW11816.1 HAMP domain-containing histidine kinase [Alloalcanivorax gelatiniphagus]|tara:strand:- start:1866 stop:3170 length:1305 start_codon:yes stop_codon:yes gene_type:complete
MTAPVPTELDATGRKNMQQLIQLRWIAVLGQIGTILVANLLFKVALPVHYMLAILAGLVVFNGLSMLRLKWVRRQVSNGELFLALLVDVVTFTLQLCLSGGATNPFIFLYLLQVVLAAVLLEAWSTWLIVLVTAAGFVWLEFAGQPLTLPPDYERGPFSLYIQGMLICFVLNAVLLVIFINRITRNRRERDERLASLRQRAAEEEHIVRMGLLASGAAHELGTPLSTLAVILGDWRHMPVFKGDADLDQEIAEMQTQVQRCKSIVSGILLSAGEARGESSAETTVHAFLDDIIQEWRRTRPVRDFAYYNEFGEDVDIASDSAIKQSLHNVLDNALEASRQRVSLTARRRGDELVLTVSDDGPGFSDAMLARLGRPYHSTKGRAGSGLGLFLVVNVARTLGGGLEARNRPQGGAEVTLSLPLDSLMLEDAQQGDP